MVVEARKLDLPTLSLSSPQVTSLLYDPNSLSLALMHSDSTFSLYPSFSPFSLSSSSLPPPQSMVPGPSSCACFVNLNPNPKFPNCPDRSRVVFVTAGPHSGGSRVVLRFYLLGNDGKFGKAHVVCSQNGISFDRKSGVIVDVSHGMKVVLSGSVNYLAMYSGSAGKVYVFGVKMVGNDRDLRLVKCAVIDCNLPVLSVFISSGFLVLGELHGVRVFPLRALVKGRVGGRRRSRVVKGMIENLKMPNGAIIPLGESYNLDKNSANLNQSTLMANGHACNVLEGVSSNSNVDRNHDAVKLRSLKLRQDSGEVGMQFILFDDSFVEGIKSRVPGYKTRKAISIQALSHQKFLILESNGELHLLHMLRSGCFKMRRLTGIIQVQRLAAFPDMSASAQDAWISDGLFSLHNLVICDTDTSENQNDRGCNEEKIIQSSVTGVIFASENIQDIIALAANSIMILGRDSLYAYAIS